MSLIKGQLEEIWSALRAAANRRRSALQAVRIRNLRGIGDLRVPFSYTQQQTMLELQRLALRRELQIIVATHSPVVLDSVPEEARLFLDRDDASAEVRLVPPYRDLLQKALYGQSRDQLSILCEGRSPRI